MSSNKMFSIMVVVIIVYGYLLPYDLLYDISSVSEYIDWFSGKFKAVTNTLKMTSYYKEAIFFCATVIFFYSNVFGSIYVERV